MSTKIAPLVVAIALSSPSLAEAKLPKSQSELPFETKDFKQKIAQDRAPFDWKKFILFASRRTDPALLSNSLKYITDTSGDFTETRAIAEASHLYLPKNSWAKAILDTNLQGYFNFNPTVYGLTLGHQLISNTHTNINFKLEWKQFRDENGKLVEAARGQEDFFITTNNEKYTTYKIPIKTITKEGTNSIRYRWVLRDSEKHVLKTSSGEYTFRVHNNSGTMISSRNNNDPNEIVIDTSSRLYSAFNSLKFEDDYRRHGIPTFVGKQIPGIIVDQNGKNKNLIDILESDDNILHLVNPLCEYCYESVSKLNSLKDSYEKRHIKLYHIILYDSGISKEDLESLTSKIQYGDILLVNKSTFDQLRVHITPSFLRVNKRGVVNSVSKGVSGTPDQN